MTSLLTRKLPRSDGALSELTLGTWGLCADAYGRVFEEQRRHTLARALELGVTSFDMAPVWGPNGLSETAVAEAAGERRKELVYITRAGKQRLDHGLESDFSEQGLRASCEASLGRLKTDYLDVLLMHNPSEAELRSDELKNAAAALQSEGKIRLWGASVSAAEDARAALEVGVQVLCIPFNLLSPHTFWDIEGMCMAQGVAVLARSVLMYGMLAAHFGAQKRFAPDDHRAQRWSPEALKARVRQSNELRDHLQGGPALSVLSLAARFVLSHEAVTSAVIGPRTPTQVETLVNAIEGERPTLPDAQRVMLRAKVSSF
ncbi:MAG TPA: aldo/keto reductase [Polyangiales bacterium]|nr:aldo/keto reductase [Polyangiales bacterium]